MFAVNVQPFGLAIGCIGATQVRSLVPVEAQPLEVGDQLILKAGFAALDVGIFDAQHHGSTLLPGEKPVKQSSARITDVKMPGRRRSKSDTNRRGWSH